MTSLDAEDFFEAWRVFLRRLMHKANAIMMRQNTKPPPPAAIRVPYGYDAVITHFKHPC